MVKNLRGKVGQIVLIDVNLDSPEIARLKEQRDNADSEMSQAMGDFEDPNSMVAKLSDLVETTAKYYLARDQTVISQLRNEIDGSPDALKISIIQGGDHTASYHHFSTDSRYETNREFLMGFETPSDTRNKVIYPLFSELVRSKIFNTDAELDITTLKRDIVAVYIDRILTQGSVPDFVISTKVRSWSDDQITRILDGLHQLGSQLTEADKKSSLSSDKVKALRQFIISALTNS
ncbi:hypothetical protein HYX70_01740 [Candidatus Saccharibacteria bacterium]|nr:hypothetical protein [Candidatus Saccharibacteria bacterium]